MTRRAVALGCVVLLVLAATGVYLLMNARSMQLFGGLTNRVDTERRVVALTFDDGPTCGDVDPILRSLGGTPATFLVVGTDIDACPGGAERLVRAGAELGNHTWSHRRMIGVTPQTVADEIEPTDQRIRAAGYQGEISVRQPYGKKLLVLPWWLRDHDRHTVMWDVAVETYDGNPEDTATITRQTIEQARPGSIILLHPWNGRATTQRAIRPIIDGLEQRGYTFVTVSQLLAEQQATSDQ